MPRCTVTKTTTTRRADGGYRRIFAEPLDVHDGESIEFYGDEARIVRDGCLSTHGGAGYVFGSYKDGDTVICAMCNRRVPYVPGRGV